MKKKILLTILCVTLVFSNSMICFAEGKTAKGFENNSPTGTSDAQAFVNGIKGQDSAYSTTYKSPSQVTNNDFFDKTHAIKYWSSHGNNSGQLWGANNSVSVNIFDQTFSWTGNNLEFAFLAACRQLDGLGSNPRSRYAKAMIGDKAVRVICGYHESAPAAKDKDVADKFISYAKTGESVKSAWILANKYWQDQGWSTGVYCVLTHSGNVQYSRFPGFPGGTYTRPGASSTSILRFSSANPNGTSQPYSANGLTFNNDISNLSNMDIPAYTLQASQKDFVVEDGVDKVVLRDSNNLVLLGKEIGDEKLEISETDAIINCKNELVNTITNSSEIDLDSAAVSVKPILMAEVNLEGGNENESVVAYDVTFKNTYEGIEILGDCLSGVVDGEAASYLSAKWNEMTKVEGIEGRNTLVDFNSASQMVAQQLNTLKSNTDINSNVVSEAKLAFVLNEETGNYEPHWIFSMENAVVYKVNCMTSAATILE